MLSCVSMRNISSSPDLLSPVSSEYSGFIVHASEPLPTPTPEPKKSSTPEPKTDLQKNVVNEIEEVWGEDSEIGRAMAFCESTYGVNQANPESSARGVFQFIKGTWVYERNQMGEDPNLELRFNIQENVKTAYSHYQKNGLQPWWPSINCMSQYIEL